MKTLIVYYSRTGFTRQLAGAIGNLLGADREELTEKTSRDGIKGYLVSGKEAMKKITPAIDEMKNDLAVYDLVIVGTPVWVGTMASPVRTFLTEYEGRIRKAAFFTTQGSAKRQKVFDEMESLINGEAIAEMMVTTKKVKQSEYQADIDRFIQEINENM